MRPAGPSMQLLAAARRSATRQLQVRHIHYEQGPQPPRRGGKLAKLIAVFGLSAAAVYYYPQAFPASKTSQGQPSLPAAVPAELEFEKPRKTKSKERDPIILPQDQVKTGWENPGVFVWGSNSGLVADPSSPVDRVVKTPRRLPYFDGLLLRDLKLAQDFGAAVDESGNLVQWGVGFSKADPMPSVTLRGKDLVQVAVSADRVIALASSGHVYSLPASKNDLETGAKALEGSQQSQGSGFSLWRNSGSSSGASVNYRSLMPVGLASGEKVTQISSGREHCLMLTSKGRVFSAASSTHAFPSKGQMGIPNLSWDTRPKGPYDQAHEISALAGCPIAQIATGEYHSIVLDKTGQVFSFGDNTFGQLGFSPNAAALFDSMPKRIAWERAYNSRGWEAKVTSIAAGGLVTYCTVELQSVGSKQGAKPYNPKSVVDLWAFGRGLYGALGNGKWTHVSDSLAKVKLLSSVFEFDERTGQVVPVRLAYVTAGSTHTAAVLADVSQAAPSSNTLQGAEVGVWGGNEHYQLGTGKRNNLSSPEYMAPFQEAKAGTAPGAGRVRLMPRQTVRLGEGGKGRKVSMEQRIECGENVTAIYSRTWDGGRDGIEDEAEPVRFTSRLRSLNVRMESPCGLLATQPARKRVQVQEGAA